jgi:hypothetical protein
MSLKTTISMSLAALLLVAACAPKNKGNPVYNPKIIRACPVKTTVDGKHYCAWNLKDVKDIYKMDAELVYFRKHCIAKERWLYIAVTAISVLVGGLTAAFK